MKSITPPLDFVMTLVSTQAQILKKIEQQLYLHGLSFSEFLVLHQLKSAPHNRMRRIELAESVGLTASGVTRLLLPMEKIKLIEKESNPRDARVSLVKLSKTGAVIYADSLQSVEFCASNLMKPLSLKQQSTLINLLRML